MPGIFGSGRARAGISKPCLIHARHDLTREKTIKKKKKTSCYNPLGDFFANFFLYRTPQRRQVRDGDGDGDLPARDREGKGGG